MNTGELCFEYPMYGYNTLLNGDIVMQNIDMIELDIKRQNTEQEAKEFIENDKKIKHEINVINDMVIPTKTQPYSAGAGRQSIFKIKNKYRSKYV